MNTNRISLTGVIGIIVAALVGLVTIAAPATAHSRPMKGGFPTYVAEIANVEEECETLTGPHYYKVDLCVGLGVPVKGGGDVVWTGTARLADTSFRYGEPIYTTRISALVLRCDGSYQRAGTTDMNVVASDDLTGNLTGRTNLFQMNDAKAVYVWASWVINWPEGGSTWHYGTGEVFDLTGPEYYGKVACNK